MKIRLLFFVLGMSFLYGGYGTAQMEPVQAVTRPRSQLGFQFGFQPSLVPLTTERVWNLDPDELNPHRRRWVLQRQAELTGLEAVQLTDGRFGVRAVGISAAAKSYIRPAGPWYRPISEFPCTTKAEEWFANEDGAKQSVDQAAVLWRDLLSERRVNVAAQLDSLSAGTPDIALLLARHLFENWLKQADQDWRKEIAGKVIPKEWELYTKLAKAAGVCEQRKGKAPSIEWDQMMEPVPATGTPRLLVRAPARRWDGLYSVRVDVVVGQQRINGRFLLDSTAKTSVLSPRWLESQGVLPVWVQLRTTDPERVSGLLWPTPGLARRAAVDEVQVSGMSFPIREFLLFETEFFDPPETVGSCCDGVLGMDFLAGVVAEFSPGPPAEIKFWERTAFRPAQEKFIWTELSAASSGMRSSCGLRSGGARIEGVRWNTGSRSFVQVHLPWGQRAQASKIWSLECEGRVVAADFSPQIATKAPRGSGLDVRNPGFDAGIALLGSGAFIFDLPHGRFWLPSRIPLPLPRRNSSGLELKYVMRKGERVLRVQKIDAKRPASALAAAGLKVGMFVSQINLRPAEEMDQWDVDQILSGHHGEQAEVRWETRAGAKIAPLKVR